MNKFYLILFLIIFQFFSPCFAQADVLEDIPKTEPVITEPEPNKELPYNYLDTTSIPIYLSIVDEISTKDELIEGELVDFRVIKDVVYNKEIILKQGTIIKGQIATIITSGMNGFPAEIIVDNFQIPGIRNSQLMSQYTKKGQNRCFWVYPLKWSLTLIPFVGSLTNLIMGGHAKIKTSDIITIYYYPKWR